MDTILSTLKPEFTWAGFTFPKHAWTLPRGDFAKRVSRRKPVVCGEYYGAPKPDATRSTYFYLGSDFMPGLRWKWADEIISIRHTGWFTDEHGDGDTLRGIVMRLPHGRGFLAGYSMGKGMISRIDYGRRDIYDDEKDAARAADSIAENAADREREYQAQEREREAQEERGREEAQARADAKRIRIYDNGGKTADRYTVIAMNCGESSGLYAAIGMSERPFHPQGFGQHTSAAPGRHLGKRITLDDLPEQAQKFARVFIEESR